MTYHFDEHAASLSVSFYTDCLRHVQGPLAGQPFDLLPWQKSLNRELFGWKDAGGHRKYTHSYVEVPRKQGKTTWLAGLALYTLLTGERGGQVIGCATSLDQASYMFDIAAGMVHQSEYLSSRLEVLDSKKRILFREKGAYYRAIPADDKRAHGSRPTVVLFDELHKQPNRKLWDAMATGMGSTIDPLFISITTAGWDRSSICWEQHVYAEKVRDGVIDDDPHFLPAIYAADPDDAWDDPAVWRKANPSFGVSVPESFYAKECRRAKEQVSYENTFRNLYLNQWTEQAERWLPISEWDKGACDLDDAELIGAPCWAGLDLSATRDVTALCLVFQLPDDVFAIKSFLWCPEKPRDLRAQQDRTQVVNWANQGHIDKHPGDTIEYELLAEQVVDICNIYGVELLAVDPSGNAEAVIQMCVRNGWDIDKVEKFAQNAMNYSPAMNDMERRLALGKLKHDGNPAMRWMASNVAAKADHNGHIKPDKEASGDKIDGIVAALMALALGIHYQTDGPSVYTTRGALEL